MSELQLKDFKIHYVEKGSGSQAIVFVHGFISSQRWWQPALERLSGQDYHAYALDLRACGDSEQVPSGHTLAQFAEDIHEFVESLNLSNFILVGHSMGGAVSMHYALKHQDRLKALVLVSPVGPGGTTLSPEEAAFVNAQQGVPEGLRMLVSGAFATLPDEAYLNELIVDAGKWDKPVYLSTMDDMGRVDITGQLGGIKVPTLLTWGDKDTVIPFRSIADIFNNLPGCNLEIWHGIGHSGPVEATDRFVALLDQFIKEVSKTES